MFKLRKIFLFFISIIFLSLIYWVLYISIIFPKYHYDQGQFVEKGQYPIIVLTGGKGRIEKGLELLKRGYGNYLFVSGVNPNVNINNKFSIEPTNEKLIECCIFFGQQAKDTFGNLLEVDNWLSDKKINEFFLVSSYYHLPRVKFLFEKNMKDRKIHLIPVGKFPDSSISLLNQFFSLRILIIEYLKIIYLVIVGF